ncbi:hypothetical protein [Streptomyces sp. NBC_00358]
MFDSLSESAAWNARIVSRTVRLIQVRRRHPAEFQATVGAFGRR